MEPKTIGFTLLTGLVAGWLASFIVGGGGLFKYIIWGVIGSFVGNFLFRTFNIDLGIQNGIVRDILTATIGAPSCSCLSPASSADPGATIMSFIAWIVIGGLAGWIADAVSGSDHGLLTNILLGIARRDGRQLAAGLAGLSAGARVHPLADHRGRRRAGPDLRLPRHPAVRLRACGQTRGRRRGRSSPRLILRAAAV